MSLEIRGINTAGEVCLITVEQVYYKYTDLFWENLDKMGETFFFLFPLSLSSMCSVICVCPPCDSFRKTELNTFVLMLVLLSTAVAAADSLVFYLYSGTIYMGWISKYQLTLSRGWYLTCNTANSFTPSGIFPKLLESLRRKHHQKFLHVNIYNIKDTFGQ